MAELKYFIVDWFRFGVRVVDDQRQNRHYETNSLRVNIRSGDIILRTTYKIHES